MQKESKVDTSLEERKKNYAVLKEKYPDRIPVIVHTDKEVQLTKNKFLANREMKVGEFLYIVRQRLTSKLNANDALFLFVDRVQMNEKGDISVVQSCLLSSSLLFSEIEKQYVSQDGFLYLKLCKENTFGCCS